MSEMHDVATSEPYLAAPGARDGFQVKGVLKVVDSAGYALFGELAKATTGGSDTASEEAFGEHGRAMPQGAYNAAKTKSLKVYLQRALNVVRGGLGLNHGNARRRRGGVYTFLYGGRVDVNTFYDYRNTETR